MFDHVYTRRHFALFLASIGVGAFYDFIPTQKLTIMKLLIFPLKKNEVINLTFQFVGERKSSNDLKFN